jgi:pimeloyl-ACP methyl ester carboxylesterase
MATELMEPARPFPYVEGVEHRFVDIGDLRLHVAEAGAGDPLVMLHGWPQHWYEWRYQIPDLAKHYRVICPDLRGLGWSDAPPEGYDKETLGADVVDLLNVLEVRQPVNLVGHDWGGWAGFLICLHHPELVRRYLVLNTGHPWGRMSLRSTAILWRFWYQYLIASPGLGERIVSSGRLARFMLTYRRPEAAKREEDIAAFLDPLREPARAKASVQIYRTFLLRELLPVVRGRYRSMRLKTPTLFLHGTGDPVIKKDMLEGYEPFTDDMQDRVGRQLRPLHRRGPPGAGDGAGARFLRGGPDTGAGEGGGGQEVLTPTA